MEIYEMVKNDPKFKRFCARQSTRPIAKPKRFKVPIPRPQGKWSVLGPYTTGRLVRVRGDCEHIDCPDCTEMEVAETLLLKREGNDIVSELPDPTIIEVAQDYEWIYGKMGDQQHDDTTETHARLIELLEEQNRLLRQLAA